MFFCEVEGAPKYTGPYISSLSKQHWDPKIPKKNCAEWYASGHVYDGVYTVEVGGNKFSVYCDMLEDQGGWTVIQRSVPSGQKYCIKINGKWLFKNCGIIRLWIPSPQSPIKKPWFNQVSRFLRCWQRNPYWLVGWEGEGSVPGLVGQRREH